MVGGGGSSPGDIARGLKQSLLHSISLIKREAANAGLKPSKGAPA